MQVLREARTLSGVSYVAEFGPPHTAINKTKRRLDRLNLPAGAKGPPATPAKGLKLPAKPSYAAPRFRVVHWVKAPRGAATIWARLPKPLPEIPEPFPGALERLFGVKPPAAKAPGACSPGCK